MHRLLHIVINGPWKYQIDKLRGKLICCHQNPDLNGCDRRATKVIMNEWIKVPLCNEHFDFHIERMKILENVKVEHI